MVLRGKKKYSVQRMSKRKLGVLKCYKDVTFLTIHIYAHTHKNGGGVDRMEGWEENGMKIPKKVTRKKSLIFLLN